MTLNTPPRTCDALLCNLLTPLPPSHENGVRCHVSMSTVSLQLGWRSMSTASLQLGQCQPPFYSWGGGSADVCIACLHSARGAQFGLDVFDIRLSCLQFGSWLQFVLDVCRSTGTCQTLFIHVPRPFRTRLFREGCRVS